MKKKKKIQQTKKKKKQANSFVIAVKDDLGKRV